MKKSVVLLSALVLGCAEQPSFETFAKIDAHVHIDTFDPAFVQFAAKLNFKLMTLVTTSSSQERIDHQLARASHQQRAFPQIVGYSTTFSMENWSADDWQAQTIARLERDFAEGAVAVKVWKDIGMTFREADGRFIMIDDPRFDPIFDFIAAQGKTVVGHLGEPRNCWLPIEEMTVRNDSSYFAEHPEYHMYLHPDFPSYEKQIEARDNMLAKHPNLRFVGAHLGSLEWSVDELAKTLDRFPNMAVDMAARIGHLQVQERDKVRDFIIKYQGRLLYGTDLYAPDGGLSFDYHLSTWKNDWRYFTTDELMTAHEVRQPFRGLKLPRTVLKKIYHDNAIKWLNAWQE